MENMYRAIASALGADVWRGKERYTKGRRGKVSVEVDALGKVK
jgi:hypothetical protein